MAFSVVIHQSAKELAVPLTQFHLDWHGKPVRHPTSFGFRLHEDRLVYRFRSDKSADCDKTLVRGQFVAELWTQDVAEFFVRGIDASYQEFNVSPTGAWWSAAFGQYRSLVEEVPCSSVRIQTTIEERNWEIEFSVPLAEIVVLRNIDLRDAHLNPAGILNPRDPEYLCFGHTDGGEPDFHRAENFLPITLL